MLQKLPLLLLCLLGCILHAQVSSQQVTAGDAGSSWIRVYSDDGEFSVEVPAAHKYYTNADGFSVSQDQRDFDLRNMRMLNAHVNRTTLSFEIYDAKRGALDVVYDMDKSKGERRERSDIRVGGVKMRRVVDRGDSYFFARHYFATRGRVYVLTAISRDSETAEVGRFLGSVEVASDGQKLDSRGGMLLSKLTMTDIMIELVPAVDSPKPADPGPATPKPPEPGVVPLMVLSKPRASYTNQARNGNVQGSILLRVTLSEDGYVPKIIVRRGLPGGLLRQALLSAVRLKFLPKERNGVPESVSQTLEYTFSIY